MHLGDTLKIPSATLSNGATKRWASFPNAEFWMAVVFLTMTIRGLTLWELGEGQAHGRIGDMVLLVVIGLWFGGRCLAGNLAIVRNRLDLAVTLFVALHAASMLWAGNVDAGSVRLLKLVRNFALYVLLAEYLSGNFLDRYKRVAVYLFVSAVFLSLTFAGAITKYGGMAALGMLLQEDAVPSSNPLLYVVRHDQGLGVFMMGFAAWLPLCMFVAFTLQPWITSRTLALGNLLYFYGMGAVTLLSASRSAMAGLAGGVVITFSLLAPGMTVKTMISGCIIGLVVLFGAWHLGLQKFVMARFAIIEEDGAVSERLEFFEFTLERFKESPLLGMGVASIDPEGVVNNQRYWAVHNVYLQVLGEVGIIGGILFLWVIMLWIWYLISITRVGLRIEDRGVFRIAVGLLGYSGFLLIFFLAGHDLQGPEPWIIMGIVSALHNEGDRICRPARTDC